MPTPVPKRTLPTFRINVNAKPFIPQLVTSKPFTSAAQLSPQPTPFFQSTSGRLFTRAPKDSKVYTSSDIEWYNQTSKDLQNRIESLERRKRVS